MSKTQYATLLAQKLFQSNNDDEVQALVELDLDVEWLVLNPDGTTLLERAFRVIKDEDVFTKWWASVERRLPELSLWTALPNGKALAENVFSPSGAFPFKTRLLEKERGTPQQWEALQSSPVAEAAALRPTWEGVCKALDGSPVPASVVSHLSTYRLNSLFLTASSESEFRRTAPAHLTPTHALGMFAHFNRNPGFAAKNPWYLRAFLDSPWDKWSDDEKDSAMAFARPQALIEAMERQIKQINYGNNTRPQFDALVSGIETFYKKNTLRDTPAHHAVLSGAISALRGADFSSSVHDHVSKGVIRAFGRGLMAQVQQLGKNPANALRCGIWAAAIDTYAFKTTTLSDTALKYLGQTTLPETVDEVQKYLRKEYVKVDNCTLLRPADLVMLCTHLAVAHQSNPDKLRVFMDSMHGNALLVKKEEEAASAFINWSTKGMATATAQTKNEWAEMYWRAIFNVPVANQHYWLKKIHKEQDFIAPVRCWTAEFEETLLKALGKRKSSDEIQSVLSKMSLVNATAAAGEEKDEAPRRRSKL